MSPLCVYQVEGRYDHFAYTFPCTVSQSYCMYVGLKRVGVAVEIVEEYIRIDGVCRCGCGDNIEVQTECVGRDGDGI